MLVVGFIVVSLIAAYLAYQQRNQIVQALKNATGNGGSAFAKLAEAEGKIIALKAATKVKQEEAALAHAALDAVHKLLG